MVLKFYSAEPCLVGPASSYKARIEWWWWRGDELLSCDDVIVGSEVGCVG